MAGGGREEARDKDLGEETPVGAGVPPDQAARAEIRHVLEQGLYEYRPRLPPSKEVLERRGLEQDLELKRNYGRQLLRLVGLQLAAADGIFVAYAWAGKGWVLPPAVISIFLAATLVELLGIVYVVVTYLFPDRGAKV